MHSLLIDIDHTIQELRGTLPVRTPEHETAEEFRRRQAILRAIRVLDLAEREIRGESTPAQAQVEALFAFAGG